MSRQREAVMSDEVQMELQRLGREFRFWKRTNGTFRSIHGQAIIKVGIVGACDLTGIMMGRPAIPFEVELKWGKNSLDPDQIIWRDFCLKFGIPWFLCHAEEPTLESFRAAARATATEIQEFANEHRR